MPRSPALEGEKLERAVEMKKSGASYPEIAEEFDISQSVAYRNVKPQLEKETEKERKTEKEKGRNKGEMEKFSDSTFRKSLELFIDGKDCGEIAEKLDVAQATIEYELLPYVHELKTTRKLQKKVEELV